MKLIKAGFCIIHLVQLTEMVRKRHYTLNRIGTFTEKERRAAAKCSTDGQLTLPWKSRQGTGAKTQGQSFRTVQAAKIQTQ